MARLSNHSFRSHPLRSGTPNRFQHSTAVACLPTGVQRWDCCSHCWAPFGALRLCGSGGPPWPGFGYRLITEKKQLSESRASNRDFPIVKMKGQPCNKGSRPNRVEKTASNGRLTCTYLISVGSSAIHHRGLFLSLKSSRSHLASTRSPQSERDGNGYFAQG